MKKSLKNEFILWIMLICVMICAIGLLYIRGFVFSQVENDFNDYIHQETQKIRVRIDNNMIGDARKAVMMMANDARIRNWIKTIDAQKINSQSEQLVQPNNSFAEYSRIFPSIFVFAVGTTNGNYLQYPDEQYGDHYDPRERAWFKGAEAADNHVYLSEPHVMQYSGRMLITVSSVVKDNDQVVGVVAAGWDADKLQQAIAEFHHGDDGEILIMDSANRIIIAPHDDWLMKTPQEIGFPELSMVEEGNVVHGWYDGRDYSICIDRSSATNWKIMTLVTKNEIQAKAERYLHPLFITLGVIMGLMVLLLLFEIKRNILDPIRLLTEGAQQIASGDLDARVIVYNEDEFGLLAKAFNDMADTLEDNFTRISQQNRKLYKQEQEFKTLVENTEDIICRVDRNMRVLYVNPVIERYFHLSATEIYGHDMRKMRIPAQLITAVEKTIAEPAKQHNMLVEFEVEESKLPHTLFFQAHIVPELQRDGRLYTVLLSIRDLSKRHELEKQISRLDRLNLVGEMAAGIAHEVRNPMTTVRGFLQLLSVKNHDYANYYELMINEMDRANDIITEFLSLARNKIMNRSQMDINEIINAILPLMQSDALLNDKVLMTSLSPVPLLLLDDKEVRQLILNLVRNAMDATGRKGKVTIKTYAQKNEVIVSVRDNGKGIKPEMMDKLGMPFQTTKDNGTGLGLAVCYSIAARHNARIDINTGTQGTEFLVRFQIEPELTTR